MTNEYSNPKEVETLLIGYHQLLSEAQELRRQANELSGGLLDQASKAEDAAATVKEKIREAVKEFGDYKDLSTGWEARIEHRISISYDPVEFALVAPDYAQACIVQQVDAFKVKGLLKGGLVTEDQLEEATIRKVTEAFICPANPKPKEKP